MDTYPESKLYTDVRDAVSKGNEMLRKEIYTGTHLLEKWDGG